MGSSEGSETEPNLLSLSSERGNVCLRLVVELKRASVVFSCVGRARIGTKGKYAYGALLVCHHESISGRDVPVGGHLG